MREERAVGRRNDGLHWPCLGQGGFDILGVMTPHPIRLIVAALSCSMALFAAHASAVEKIRVSLEVSAPDNMKAEVISYLSRELRKLEDVDIADRDVNYQISVVALRLASKAGAETGYALSVIVTSPFSGLESHPALKYAVMVIDHFVQTDSQLQPLCQSVAIELDADVFEPGRKGGKRFREMTPTPPQS